MVVMKNATANDLALRSDCPQPAEQLLPIVYQHLLNLAGRKLAREKPGHSLQPAGLVHEAYARLLNGGRGRYWDNKRHFVSAAAEAMRRILIEKARKEQRIKHGGRFRRVALQDVQNREVSVADRLVVRDALEHLAEVAPQAATVVQLRFFRGLSFSEVAESLRLSEKTVYRRWSSAREWLCQAMSD